MKSCVHTTFCPLSKILSTQNELVSVDYTLKVGDKQFSEGASPESPRSKFAVVGLQDQFGHHTLQLPVYMYKVHSIQLQMLQR